MRYIKIYFTFLNEKELVELRVKYLNDIVDCFLIVEADFTHTGKEKKWNFPEILKNNLKKFSNKIQYHQMKVDLEKAEAIKRLGILYKNKKNKGIKIKGRIRDNIASDLGISGIKVERLNKLNKLIPGLKEALGRNKISPSAVEKFSGMMCKHKK